MASFGLLKSGDRVRTPDDLARRIDLAASGFAAAGLEKGGAIALLLRNDFPIFEATYAAGNLGAFTVPLNWHGKPDETSYVVADCGARIVIAHADLLPRLGPLPDGALVLVVETPPEIAAAYGVAAADCKPPPGSLLWEDWLTAQTPWDKQAEAPPGAIIYTSGTTGKPKGVRRNPVEGEAAVILQRYRLQVFPLHDKARTVLVGPMYHSAPCNYGLMSCRAGTMCVLQAKFEPEELLKLIEAERITHLHMVPTMFVRLLRLPEDVRRRYDTSSLQHVVHGAAPCAPDVKRAMIDWWGPVIHEYYGATESGPIALCNTAEWLAHPGTVGRITPDARVSILDDQGRELPVGEIGEIYVRHPAVPDFVYLGKPEARRAIERNGMITNGDVGRVDADGFLYLTDRKKDMVISGGVNIYPAEIEANLISHPAVQDCAVFGIPDREFGERLLAVVQLVPGIPAETVELRAHLAARLADFKVPREFSFVASLPREDSGKIAKRRLRDPYWADAGRAI